MANITAEELLRAVTAGKTPIFYDRLKLERAVKLANEAAVERTLISVFPVSYQEDGVVVAGVDLTLSGKSLVKHIYPAEHIAVVAGTLGLEYDRLIEVFGRTDLELSLLLDIAGLELIEKVMDSTECELKNKYPCKLFSTRFSAGYGDLPLEQQGEILNVLDATRKIGIALTDGGMMTPTKSVTAIIGIKDND